MIEARDLAAIGLNAALGLFSFAIAAITAAVGFVLVFAKQPARRVSLSRKRTMAS